MNTNKGHIHTVLGHSYIFAFGMFIVGLVLDYLFVVSQTIQADGFGMVAIAAGTFLIIWAQKTSETTKASRKVLSLDDPALEKKFFSGPYRLTRIPTQIGLFLIFFGFGFLIHSFFVPLTAIVALIVNKLFFIKKEEALLLERYKDAYRNYQKRIKF